MSVPNENNKRIAQNTVFLYIRMFLTMAVTLYTSRVVLSVLGVVDYGIYNVVGGIVTMLSFINNAMRSATQRYITFALGKGEFDNLNKVFSMSVTIHFLIAIVILVVAETLGLWFFYTQMNIPADRAESALWVYQASVATTMVAVVSVPYNAAIIAHEKMSAFAYISIAEVLLKLFLVYLLMYIPCDKLKLYAILILLTHVLIRYIYVRYCKSNFLEARYKYVKDKGLFGEMVSFAGWSLFGSLASQLSTNGVNIILNMFFGPVINAARGVAVQVQAAILSFSHNFQTAVNPQITKSYAIGDKKRLFALIQVSSKFSFFLLMIMILPILVEPQFILSVWLTEVPEHSANFLRLILLTVLIDTTANSFIMAAQATGRVKVYQSVVGSCILLIVPLSYITMRLMPVPELVFLVHLVIAVVAQILRIIFMRSYIGLRIKDVLLNIYIPCAIVMAVSCSVPMALHSWNSGNSSSAIIVIVASVLWALPAIYFLGFSKREKGLLKSFVRKRK